MEIMKLRHNVVNIIGLNQVILDILKNSSFIVSNAFRFILSDNENSCIWKHPLWFSKTSRLHSVANPEITL